LPEDWQGAVFDSLSQAGSSHIKASQDIYGGMSVVRSANAEYGKQRDTVHQHFVQKLANTHELVSLLSSKIHSVTKCTQHSEWSLKQLQTAHQALAGPTSICTRRLELRSRLPRRERVQDAFQEALQYEERELQAAKARFSTAISATQRVIKELMMRKEDLKEDLLDKQHGLNLDNACVDKKALSATFPRQLDKCYNRSGISFATVAGTPRMKTPSVVGESAGFQQEKARQKLTQTNVEQALRIEEAARIRCAENTSLLEATSRALKDAHRSTQAEMAAKVEHTEVFRQELLKQQKTTLGKVAELQKYLGLTAEKLEAIEKPLTANETRERIRSSKVPREAISDHVSEALHEQQRALQGKKMQLQSQTAVMKQTLEELLAMTRQLAEDIEEKDQALAIDRACAGVKNPAHSTLGYGFARVGGGQRHLSDTGSSKMRQTPTGLRASAVPATPRIMSSRVP